MFKDIWGSDLIFAGPHKTFTTGNKTSNINHVIFGIHSVISEHESEDESWTDKQLSDHSCVLSNNGHIDDINPGAETEARRDDQNLSTQVGLRKQGCFGSKYLVYSGIEPGERVRPDGVPVELPGYRRNSRNNAVYPGFAGVNASKKTRGATNSNIVPVVTLENNGVKVG